MNIMRKFLVGHSRPSLDDPQHAALGLMHLKKLFSEYCHPSQTTSMAQKEQEDKLYNMLPLFCKVFGNSPAKDMTEKFTDILPFCQQVSKLMVSEIRRRASNQSTEAASSAIVKFLEIENTEEASSGWMLLSTINLLAAGDSSLIEVMTASSLPSTLVKCLYLFFDLPEVASSSGQVSGGREESDSSEFTPSERHILLQKIFVQVLVRLCSHVAPAEELARKDDLTLLFSAITSWCPAYNVAWRKSAAEVLMTLSRNCLCQTVVSYIHNKGCVALCIDNMQRVQELSPLEIVEMLVTVSCFLKDSTEVSQTLLDDFRSCQGYIYLSEFLLRLEQMSSNESQEALRNLVLLLASLSLSGYIELKPSQASTGSLFQMQGFHIPQPSGQGVSVRNIQAFQVLQSVFLKATSVHLTSVILDAINGIYHSDTANYFILEPQHTLSQFAEKIHTKPPEVQEKFFQILEFIVNQLNFVPCKELISLSILLKTQTSVESSITCMRTVLNMLKHDDIFKDVYREVGLLEVMVTCLHRFASSLKEIHSNSDEGPKEIGKVPESAQTLGFLVMEALTNLLANNNSNAGVFRECGGARCAHNMVPYPTCRQQALDIVKQLVLCNGGDDDMGTLLGMMHSAPVLSLEFKTHILKSLLQVLRESHRTRTVFRKVGGFVYVMSGLVSMEGCLAHPPVGPWESVDRKLVLTFLKMVFNTLTVAMRFEPANAKFFAQEICYTSLTDTIRLLGCFSNDLLVDATSTMLVSEEENPFHLVFTARKDQILSVVNVPQSLALACLMLRLLYDMALDAFDRPKAAISNQSPGSKKHGVASVMADSEKPLVNLSPPANKRLNLVRLNLGQSAPDPVIVHPGVVIAILHLLPSIKHPIEKEVALMLQLYTAEVLKSLVRSERNQQVMCDAGMPHELLSRCNIALEDESHPLHDLLQYMLERLAAQALEPKDLRDFLRLGHPLCCKPFDSFKPEPLDDNGNSATSLWPANKREGGPVPLTRVKTLVSMTTPKDFRVNGASLIPPSVEFDMSNEGFGCLYLPSIAPQSVSGPTVVGVGMVGGGVESSVLGGVGTGDRIFPPQTGLTYSSWICVEKFSDQRNDPHCVWLLSLVRNLYGKDDHLLCLMVLLSAQDKALIVSTQETPLSQAASADWEPNIVGDGCIRFWCPELIQEGQWHHVVLVLNRSVLKNSSISLYIDGQHIKTQKLHYISQNPGGGAANLTVASSVYGYVGTPPSRRRHSRLVWKQGPCQLLEEILPPHVVNSLFRLGPNYLGSLQAPILHGNEVIGPLVSEEKVVFGLNAVAMSGLTLARIRKVYSKVDSKTIAKQLGMSSHENATPIYIMHNSAGHLSGPARSLGGVLIGYLGARGFCPRPVARIIENVGGCPALLGLIAMANDVEELYAAVKALVCVVRSNKATQLEMDRIRGYQTLAMLLKKKRSLLNSHILHLTFSLVGTVDSGRENTVIPNATAFQDLLCDLEIWHEAPGDLQRTLYEHFFELVNESSEQAQNLKLIRKLGMVPKLLHILKDPTLSNVTTQIVNNVLGVLLNNTPNSGDLLKFGQFVASTLPTMSVIEKNVSLDDPRDKLILEDVIGDFSGLVSAENILLRNRCLNLLFSMLHSGNKSVNTTLCEDVASVLGFDWLLLFLQGHLHSTTIILALRILLVVMSNQSLMQKFREGNGNGGWLQDTEPVLENRMGVVLGFNVGSASAKPISNREIKEEAFHVPGFQHLQWLMPKHIHTPELYFLLLALLLGQPVRHLPHNLTLNLDSIWSFLFGVPSHKSTSRIANRVDICPDAVLVILAMIRTMLNQPIDDSLPWLKEYPVTLIQFLLYLYHNTSEFVPVCMTSEVLCGLAATLFLYRNSSSENNSEVASPVDDFSPYPGADTMVLVKTNEKFQPPAASLFTNHPAKKFVMDFMRVIVVDSLSFPVTSKSPPVIDLLLDAVPEQSNRVQQCEFQTEMLASLMDHLMAADVLLGEQAALPIVSGGSYSYIAPNVFYLATRLVDKLWHGLFTRDPHEVLDFIIKLISQAKRRSSALSTEPLYHCLNRTILYQLSRPADTVADQMAVLEALHKLTSNRTVVFGTANSEQDFVSCLCYCLLQLTEEIAVPIEANRKTTWHVNPSGSTTEKPTMPSTQEGQGLLVTAAKRVWEELYISKKQIIEEAFKINLSNQTKIPDLHFLRDVVYEPASKVWLIYIESERKSSFKPSWELQSQFQQVVNFSGLQKLQKVTGGLSRLANRRAKREESVKFKQSNVSMPDLQIWTLGHITIVRDLVDLQYKQCQQSNQHMQKYVFEEWLQTETELTRERGIWGPPVKSLLDKWMLDMTEGPSRMRKKMMKNEMFYFHYPFRPELETGDNRALKYKVAMSSDSKKYYQCQRSAGMVEREAVPSLDTSSAIATVETQSVVDISDVMREIGFQGQRSCLLSRPSFNRNASDLDDEQESSFDASSESSAGQADNGTLPENQTLLRLLEEGEKIGHMFRCARIQGLDTSEGLLLFGKEHFYVVDGFTLLKTREIRDIDYLPANMYDPIIPNTTNYRSQRDQKKLCSKFAYEDVREVHKRRYLLQPIALEVFSADGRNYLLAFPRGIRNKIYHRFMAMATAINDNAQQSVAGQKRTANVEQSASLLSSLIGETSVTQRWVRGEISNFQYLMHLNTLAGRSYNDLMQYPVFPWILADYDSEELDFNRSCTFRDFSKPMGAQSIDRLKQFKKRYKEWDDPHGETPPYHYGTHYSSAMIVASYLVRMEPFTQHFLGLQGGHFDLADRMFHSIKEAWLSASKHNMADVKELIPEFFYLPEFLKNSNNFDLGCKQNGITLHDIILPPWAKGDPREFIRVHRQALECDYVSCHLHEWIDLIFGYKQHGATAVEATNVFHHLFYEGNVDIYTIDDPLKKNATIGFINNFGQIPKQLFKKSHPAKKLNHRTSLLIDPIPLAPVVNCSPDRLFFHNLDNLKPSMAPIRELKGSVGQIMHNDKSVQAVEQNKVLIPASYARYLAWGFADQSLRIGNYECDKATFVYEMTQYGEVLCAACPNSKLVITAGTSTVVNVWEFNKKQLILKESLYGHREPVTCVAASPSYNLIVSGSRDRTCILWDMSRMIFVRQLSVHAAPVAAVSINELTGDIATCAGTYLYLWSINGQEIASVNTAIGRSDRLQQILCVAFSQLYEWDSLNVVMTGSSDGVVRMWSTDYVQVPIKEETKAAKLSEPSRPADPSSGSDFNVEHELLTAQDAAAAAAAGATNLNLSADHQDLIPAVAVTSTESKIQEYVRRLSLAGAQEIGNESSDIYCWVMGRVSPTQGSLAKSGSESSLSDEEPAALNKVSRLAKLSETTNEDKQRTALVGLSLLDTNNVDALLSLDESNGSPIIGSRLSSSGDSPSEPASTRADLSLPESSEPDLQLSALDVSLPSIEVVSDDQLTALDSAAAVPSATAVTLRRSGGAGSGLSVANHIHRSSTIIQSDVAEDDRSNNIRISKSDTSLTDSFVLVTESEISEAAEKGGTNGAGEVVLRRLNKLSHNWLREGFRWQCQLVFRSKLTMHTAFDRKDNADPSAVTALAISKDHKTVYIGDAKGRVYSWSVTDHPGRVMADHWVKDECGDSCIACNIKFTFSERRHHCRNCGQLFCSRCSRFESEISRLRILKPVRVCQTCYSSLKLQHNPLT